MKANPPTIPATSSALFALFALCLAASALPSGAEEEKEAKEAVEARERAPAAKGGKGGKAKAPDPFAAAFVEARESEDEPAGLVNVGLLIQHIDVARERWEDWLAENEVPTAASAEGLRREVESWIAAGEAELAETSLAMSRPGQRTRTESGLSVVYATEYHDGDGSSQPFPVENEPRFVGSLNEVDPQLGRDGSLAASLSAQRSAYLGEAPPREELGVQDGDLRWPLFGKQEFHGSAALGPEQWALLGSFAAMGRPETHRTLLFVRPAVHRFEGEGGPGGRTDPFRGVPMAEATLAFTWLELSHEALNALLMEAEDFSALIGGGLREAAAGVGGKVTREQVLRIQSGRRTKSEAVSELRLPTGFSYPARRDGLNFAAPHGIETWNIGTAVEVDAVVADDGTVDLSFAPEWIADGGTDVLHRVLVGDEWVPNYTLPRIHRMRSSVQLSLPSGVPVLAAVLTPPDKKGRPEPGRKVLLFVEVSD